MEVKNEPTPHAAAGPEPFSEDELAVARRNAAAGLHTSTYCRLLATLDATRTALAQAQEELQAEEEAHRLALAVITDAWKRSEGDKDAAEAALGQMREEHERLTGERMMAPKCLFISSTGLACSRDDGHSGEHRCVIEPDPPTPRAAAGPEPLTEEEIALVLRSMHLRTHDVRDAALIRRLLATLDAAAATLDDEQAAHAETRTALAQAQGERDAAGKSADRAVEQSDRWMQRADAAEAALGQMREERAELIAHHEHHHEHEKLVDADLSAARRDREDWRKGVALIAFALGEPNPPDLSCVRLAEVALMVRANLEAARAAKEAAERARDASRADVSRIIQWRDNLAPWLPPISEVIAGGNPEPSRVSEEQRLRDRANDAEGRALAAEATVGGLREALTVITENADAWAISQLRAYIRREGREALATPAPTGEAVRELVKAARNFKRMVDGTTTETYRTFSGVKPAYDALETILAHPTLVGLGEKE